MYLGRQRQLILKLKQYFSPIYFDFSKKSVKEIGIRKFEKFVPNHSRHMTWSFLTQFNSPYIDP